MLRTAVWAKFVAVEQDVALSGVAAAASVGQSLAPSPMEQSVMIIMAVQLIIARKANVSMVCTLTACLVKMEMHAHTAVIASAEPV